MQKPVRLFLVALALAVPLQSAEGHAAGPPKGRRPVASAQVSAKGAAPARRGKSAPPPSRSAHGSPSAHPSTSIGKGRAAAPKPPPAPPPVPAKSVGHPNHGRLEGGAALDTSLPYIRVVPATASDDARWGLPVFIRLIERAARGVARRYPGSILDVGDISRKNGGDLGGHHSHESGRDADIGFYAIDVRGKQVRAPGFIRFDASLASTNVPGARFDIARNWLLVQHMLTDPGARVSHIFIAEPLRQSLLAYARSRGVSRALWNRAAIAMMQPTNSLPHDNHMHVRISCPRSTQDECVELAKNAPSKRPRMAKNGRRRGDSPVLKTPGHARHAKAGRAAPGRVTAGGSSGRDKPKLARAVPAEPGMQTGAARRVLDRALDAVDDAIDGAPGISEQEAEADAAEEKDALDESGAEKMPD